MAAFRRLAGRQIERRSVGAFAVTTTLDIDECDDHVGPGGALLGLREQRLALFGDPARPPEHCFSL